MRRAVPAPACLSYSAGVTRSPEGSSARPLSGRRIVAKFGTSLLTDDGGRLRSDVMADLVRQVATLVRRGAQVAVVTSGAVAAGRDRLGRPERQRSIAQRQVLAAIGQSHLVERYDSLLRGHGLIAAQALLTRADLADRNGYLNARNTLDALLRLGAVPIVNENDVVADDELRGGAFGENDSLSALVANLIDADLLMLLSDVDGLYDADPRTHPDARLIPAVEDLDHAARCAGPPGRGGRGGMRAKVDAARRAIAAGTTVVIAAGRAPDALLRIAGGEPLGSRFPARASRTESRKRWLLSDLHAEGRVQIDAGAAEALRRDGRSLLPAGIITVQGDFGRGDVVEVVDPDGARVAVGISNYSAAETARIRGRRSAEIAELLGYAFGEEVIHRNNLALL